MLPDFYHPMKVVFPRPEFDYRQAPGGGSAKCFVPVTSQLRSGLAASLDSIKEHFHESFESHPEIPAVAKVVLRPKAHAKSHHPTKVFDDDSCPIIGGDAPGELLVSVNESGIDEAKSRIQMGKGQKLKANISAIEAILPFEEQDVLDGETADSLVRAADKQRMPIRGLIDSGTDPSNAQLQQYVIAREDEVPRSQQDNSHGTFVGGLIANSRALNSGNTCFPSVQSKIFDIVVFDRSGEIAEYDLITKIDKAVRKYPQVKVWNLSLGQAEPCRDKRFTPLGLKLDSLAKKRRVLFVIAAGNYETLPLAGWPRPNCGEDDRIGSPADSIRSLTVGSIAHIENQSACAKIDEPSPFTRRGPAPHFYIKPEISHYGGNCDPTGDCLQCGVVSVQGKNQLAENIGTSFAAPSVSTLAANVFRELEPEGDISPTLVKALLVHSAFVKSGSPKPDEVKYRGFGSPGDINDVLNCTKSSATIIFHAELGDRTWFDKPNFPMPPCLYVPRVGLRAELFMTLAYDPATDARFGIEYCRTNVTASLGIIGKNKEGKKVLRNQLQAIPKDLTKGYEDALVKDGFKWSPLKLYYRKFDSGPIRKKWRLHLGVLGRANYQFHEPQKVVLIVTIRDPANLAFVYNAIVQEMERLSWGAQNLRIASRERHKPRN